MALRLGMVKVLQIHEVKCCLKKDFLEKNKKDIHLKYSKASSLETKLNNQSCQPSNHSYQPTLTGNSVSTKTKHEANPEALNFPETQQE